MEEIYVAGLELQRWPLELVISFTKSFLENSNTGCNANERAFYTQWT
jgi:hypothetical protein